MLIRFSVANHKSIRDRQEISFVASPLKGGTSQTLEAPGLKQRLLPAALIYGANASGKSNVLHALAEMRRHVVDSFRKNEPNGRIARAPFALTEHNDAPTSFEVDLFLAGVRYTYGFDVGDRAFTREWLHAYPHGHRQVWFEREGAEPMRFGKGLKGANRAIEGFLRPNALFLSTAAQHGHVGLEEIYSFVAEKLMSLLSPAVDIRAMSMAFANPNLDSLVAFMKTVDIGIVGSYDRTPAAESLGDVFKKLVQLEKYVDGIGFAHAGVAGRAFEIKLQDESFGTLRMGQLIIAALEALTRGAVFIIDELDASLHTELALRIVSLFTDPRINTRGAQLLATTHDTNLLSSDILRRDQIWFTEKDREGATSLFPLTDFRTRREDNIERGYLDGRFGAVPYLAPLEAFARRDEEAADG